jgi:FAD/FMN-containing dehydrogenase
MSIGPNEAAIRDFRASMRGAILRPGERGYDGARRVWNGMIDKRPALIARCAGAADVVQAVQFARANDLLVSVRGGGHSASGNAVCDGGLMIDLSAMKSIRVEPCRRTARAEPGVLLGEFDRETQAFGLATTAGVVSTTGIAGLTLGGGVGYLGRTSGLACDNLLSVDLVTADGRLVTASAAENPDLFWAIRGGGGNFGVVTSFEYRLHAVGPMVLGGAVTYPFGQARDALKFYAEYSLAAPDELSLVAILATSPTGQLVVVISACYVGPLAEGERVLRPLRTFGKPAADDIGPVSYVDVQRRADAIFPHGLHYYWKSGFVTRITASAIDVLVDRFPTVSSPKSLLVYQQYGGAVGRLGQTETAFAHRQAQYDFLVISVWSDRTESESHIGWARETWDMMQPFTTGAFYVNNLLDEDEARIRTAYGQNWERLVALKNRYDPTNLFRLNANVRPTAQQC